MIQETGILERAPAQTLADLLLSRLFSGLNKLGEHRPLQRDIRSLAFRDALGEGYFLHSDSVVLPIGRDRHVLTFSQPADDQTAERSPYTSLVMYACEEYGSRSAPVTDLIAKLDRDYNVILAASKHGPRIIVPKHTIFDGFVRQVGNYGHWQDGPGIIPPKEASEMEWRSYVNELVVYVFKILMAKDDYQPR